MVNSRRTRRQKNENKSEQKGRKNRESSGAKKRRKNRPIKNEALPFSMNKLRSFPMEKLCYDLKLEALEQMDTDDVIELVKVNKGFQWMLVRDPSFIFGQHVHKMDFSQDGYLPWEYSRYLTVRKFSTSTGFRFDMDYFHLNLHEILAKLQTESVKRIDPCKKWRDPHKTYLRQLKWVNEVEFRGGKEDWKKFFADFHASVKNSAELFLRGSEFKGEELMKEQLGDFIKTQLSKCEKVSLFLDYRDLFHVCYDALSKTQVKLVRLSPRIGPSRMVFQLNVEWIVKNGIPSQNPHAGFSDHCSVSEIPAETVAFFMGYPGMESIDGDDRLPLFEQAKKLWGEDFDSEAMLSSPGWLFPRKHYLCFRRRTDLTKDGVYILRRPNDCFLRDVLTFLNDDANISIFDCVNFYAFYVSA